MTVAETPSLMTAPASGGVVIVGAGQAGGTCAALLRRYGHPGPVTLIGAEDAPPYHRPPLSKKWLAGGADDELALRTETFYADNRITLLCSTRVVAVERSARRVVLDSGGTFRYGHLVLATGAQARRLTVPGANLPGVHYLRDRDDARALRRALDAATRLVVVGGGYLGLEVAASARSLGVEVQIIEGSHRALSRAASAPVGEAVARLHHDRGVVLHVGVEVARLREAGGRVCAVELSDGRVLACDTVLAAVGATPNDELAREAGLECAAGIAVDTAGRTADPAVSAVGDVTVRPVPGLLPRRRVESVANALEQADQVASALCGRPVRRQSAPWFWSDQYDTTIQIAGYHDDADTAVLRGDPPAGHFAVFHLNGARLTAVEAVGSPREAMAGRRWLGMAACPHPLDLADPAVPLSRVRLAAAHD